MTKLSRIGMDIALKSYLNEDNGDRTTFEQERAVLAQMKGQHHMPALVVHSVSKDLRINERYPYGYARMLFIGTPYIAHSTSLDRFIDRDVYPYGNKGVDWFLHNFLVRIL